jgi:phosphoglycolate phosphatase
MHKFVLFDLDGTLVDSSEGILEAVKETLGIMEIEPPTDDEIKSCIGPPIGDSLGVKFGYSSEDIKEFYNIFRPIYKNKHLFKCRLYPGIVPLLEELKSIGCLIGIATNKRKDSTAILLDRLAIADLFYIVIAQEIETTRNKSEMISEALDSLNIEKKDVVLIGDATSDLDAAEEAKIDFIGVRYGFGFKKPVNPPYEIVDTVEELRSLLIV